MEFRDTRHVAQYRWSLVIEGGGAYGAPGLAARVFDGYCYVMLAQAARNTKIVATLQRQLHKSGPKPKVEVVIAALAMAGDEKLILSMACQLSLNLWA